MNYNMEEINTTNRRPVFDTNTLECHLNDIENMATFVNCIAVALRHGGYRDMNSLADALDSIEVKLFDITEEVEEDINHYLQALRSVV